MSEDVDVNIPDPDATSPMVDHFEAQNEQYARQFALDYAIRIETIASKNVTDTPVAVRNRIFQHAKRVMEFIKNGDIDSDEVKS